MIGHEFEDDDGEKPRKKQELSKEEKLAKDKANFLEKLAAGDINHVQTRAGLQEAAH